MKRAVGRKAGSNEQTRAELEGKDKMQEDYIPKLGTEDRIESQD